MGKIYDKVLWKVGLEVLMDVHQTIYKISRKLFQVCFCFFTIESIFLSRELYLNISNLIQILLLFFLGFGVYIMSLKNRRLKGKTIIKEVVHFSFFEWILLIFLGFNLFYILIMPMLMGISVSNAISEAGMIVMLFLFFPLYRLIKTGEIEFSKYLNIIARTCLALNVFITLLWCLENVYPGFYKDMLNFLDQLPVDIFSINEVLEGWGIVRLCPSNLVWFPFIIYIIFSEKRKDSWGNYICIFFSIFAILATYLKSLWLGFGCGLIVSFIIGICKTPSYWKKIIKIFIYIIVMIVLLDSIVFGGTIRNRFINMFGLVSEQTDEIETENTENISEKEKEKLENEKKDKEGSKESMLIRVQQIELLLDKWAQRPLTGFGYGAYVEGYTRDWRIPNYYIFESTPFALLMKTGILGIFVWLLFVAAAFKEAVKHLNIDSVRLWLSMIICFGITIMTNPLLFNTGSVFLILIMLLLIYDSKRQKG